MRIHPACIALLALLAFVGGPVAASGPACDLSSPPTSGRENLPAERQPAQPLHADVYEESVRGLRKLAEDGLEYVRKSDDPALSALVRSLVLPDPAAWFAQAFGEAGRPMAAEYEKQKEALPAQLFTLFRRLVSEKQTLIEVRRIDDPCEARVHERQYPLLIARAQPVAFYEIRAMRDPRRGQAIWFFAWVDGGFRYVGMPEVPLGLGRGEQTGTPSPARIRVGGQVQQAKLIHKVAPRYPAKASERRIQGTVRMTAVIATDGTISSIRVVQGHCWLAEEAVHAVRQWRYTPTLLAGEPVEVVTTIDVVFRLKD